MLLFSGAPELSRRRRMSPTAYLRFELCAKVFWLTSTRYVPCSLTFPMTVVSIQGADGSCGSHRDDVGEADMGEALWYLQ